MDGITSVHTIIATIVISLVFAAMAFAIPARSRTRRQRTRGRLSSAGQHGLAAVIYAENCDNNFPLNKNSVPVHQAYKFLSQITNPAVFDLMYSAETSYAVDSRLWRWPTNDSSDQYISRWLAVHQVDFSRSFWFCQGANLRHGNWELMYPGEVVRLSVPVGIRETTNSNAAYISMNVLATEIGELKPSLAQSKKQTRPVRNWRVDLRDYDRPVSKQPAEANFRTRALAGRV